MGLEDEADADENRKRRVSDPFHSQMMVNECIGGEKGVGGDLGW